MLRSGMIHKDNYSEINKYMNNYNILTKKEETKENNINKNSYINSKYKGVNYKKINTKNKKSNENLFDQEKRKILNYNNKIINLKAKIESKRNDDIDHDIYYNLNNSAGFNYKNSKFDENTYNNKNFIYENSNSYIHNLNSNSISNSKNYKSNFNKCSENNTQRNTKKYDDNTSRLIQKYKLYPFIKKDTLFRSIENSRLNSNSNTNTHTPKNKKKAIDKNIRGLIKNTKMNKFVINYRNGK